MIRLMKISKLKITINLNCYKIALNIQMIKLFILMIKYKIKKKEIKSNFKSLRLKRYYDSQL